MTRVFYAVTDWLGWALCEIAFKTDCRGPFDFYGLGCRMYDVRPREEVLF